MWQIYQLSFFRLNFGWLFFFFCPKNDTRADAHSHFILVLIYAIKYEWMSWPKKKIQKIRFLRGSYKRRNPLYYQYGTIATKKTPRYKSSKNIPTTWDISTVYSCLWHVVKFVFNHDISTSHVQVLLCPYWECEIRLTKWGKLWNWQWDGHLCRVSQWHTSEYFLLT
jgi:hypothetical protein